MIERKSDDPATHALCLNIARKCLWVIHTVLREEEHRDALNEFYGAASEEIEKVKPCQIATNR